MSRASLRIRSMERTQESLDDEDFPRRGIGNARAAGRNRSTECGRPGEPDAEHGRKPDQPASQGNCDFGQGDRDAVGTLLKEQPVIPTAVRASTNAIMRVTMPLTSKPRSADTRINAMPDIVATTSVSHANSGRMIWAAGQVLPVNGGDEQVARPREARNRSVDRRTDKPRPMDDRHPRQPDPLGERRQRSRRRQHDGSEAGCQGQPRRRSHGRSERGSDRQLGRRRGVDRTTLSNASKVTLLGRRPGSYRRPPAPRSPVRKAAPVGRSGSRRRPCFHGDPVHARPNTPCLQLRTEIPRATDVAEPRNCT